MNVLNGHASAEINRLRSDKCPWLGGPLRDSEKGVSGKIWLLKNGLADASHLQDYIWALFSTATTNFATQSGKA